jgi:hypothetical protein
MNNPLGYSDPTGHARVTNRSTLPIIVVGNDATTGKEVVRVLPPGKSTEDIGIADTDFWRPMDTDPTIWMKLSNDADLIVEDSSTSSVGLAFCEAGHPAKCSKDSLFWDWEDCTKSPGCGASVDIVQCLDVEHCKDNGILRGPGWFKRNLPYSQMRGVDWNEFVNSDDYSRWYQYLHGQRTCKRGC